MPSVSSCSESPTLLVPLHPMQWAFKRGQEFAGVWGSFCINGSSAALSGDSAKHLTFPQQSVGVQIYEGRWEALAPALPHDPASGVRLSPVCWQCYCACAALKDWVCLSPNCSDPCKLRCRLPTALFRLDISPLNGSLRYWRRTGRVEGLACAYTIRQGPQNWVH